MAHEEACQLYIEQQIEEGLAQGKNPHSIGKEVSVWVGKLFEAAILPRTIAQRARRQAAKEKVTNVTSPPTLETSPEIPEIQVPEHGGAREGAGRPQKYQKPPEPFTQAIHIAIFVISHLERITFDDPKREEALEKVRDWIDKNL
jgi:hypothetical protein